MLHLDCSFQRILPSVFDVTTAVHLLYPLGAAHRGTCRNYHQFSHYQAFSPIISP